MVGSNKYKATENEVTETHNIDQESVQKQLKRLGELKANRNTDDVQESLATLKRTAVEDENLLPHIIHAVQTHTTLGEISDTLREVFGEY